MTVKDLPDRWKVEGVSMKGYSWPFEYDKIYTYDDIVKTINSSWLDNIHGDCSKSTMFVITESFSLHGYREMRPRLNVIRVDENGEPYTYEKLKKLFGVN